MKFNKLFLLIVPVAMLAACDNPEEEVVYPKATHLYFTDYSGKKVGVIDLATPTEYTVIADETDGLDTLAGMAIDFEDGKIYVVEEMNNRVLRLNLDGSGTPEVLYDETGTDSVSTPTAIALDPLNNTLYWANSGTGQIKRGAMDGSTTPVSMFEREEWITYSYGLVYNPDTKDMFFTDLGDFASIWYYRVGSTAKYPQYYLRKADNGTIMRNPSSLYLDALDRKLYWADEGVGVVALANVSNGSTAALYTREDGITRPDGVAVDRGNKKIYWSETDTATDTYRIMRAELDGSGTPEMIVEGVESYSLVLRFENQ